METGEFPSLSSQVFLPLAGIGGEFPTFLLFLNMTVILLSGIFSVFALALGIHHLRYSRFMLIYFCLTDTSRGLSRSLLIMPYPRHNLFFFIEGILRSLLLLSRPKWLACKAQ